MVFSFSLFCSLIRMFHATFFNTISNEGINYSQCGDAETAYMVLTSFHNMLTLSGLL
jgi:hypothetical protein